MDVLSSFLLMPDKVNYTPVGDISVIVLCLLMLVLLVQNYIHKSRSFRLILLMLLNTCFAAIFNLLYRMHLEMAGTTQEYVFRLLQYVLLILNLFLYVRYLQDPLFVEQHKQKLFNRLALSVQAAAIVTDVLCSVLKVGFYIDGEDIERHGFNAFIVAYIYFAVSIFYTIIRYRNRIIRQIYQGLLATNLLSSAILVIQVPFQQISYTTVANFLLVIGVIYMFHSNPYDVNTGAVSERYFYDELQDNLDKNNTMVLLSYNIMNFYKVMNEFSALKGEFNHFFRQNAAGGILYRLPNDRLVLAFSKSYDLAQDRVIEQLLDQFKSSHGKFNLDYKLVIIETSPDLQNATEYVKLMEFVETGMVNNSIYTVRESDIQRYHRTSYILSELDDINQKKDLDDPRVLVYCQPVYNILSGKYDTAEALMRLKLEKIGMVFPDQFIPLAEQHGLIHAISMIILNKTCGAIRSLLEEGYQISRISVNFSALDIRYDDFCKEVQQIIARNQIPFEKIAIEITESRSESDFNLMKQKVMELQQLGIKFYLDDFGTGYSNFERIMEIPFDIIKFDRSMLIESAKSESSFYMVSTFASMFDKLKYSVLFEGIEDDSDEENCVKMSAKYLQGYKYSKPIPIEQLSHFLERGLTVVEA